ncbi:helix-turn-helix domain-containing protein [uncultured Megasphaera sp.]|uniref:helix-turn-helix domain-containing protein n=1 Tax=uncultured Megasphaera sp. TaxID=165188 RepID=UPI002595D910|nr:helix-turn-helix domain-containing protein [uncultured Megasphaera sp.]
MKTQYPMIPFPLIVKATDGDTEAINQILHHYRGYITKRSLRLMKDEYGNQSMVVDEVLRGMRSIDVRSCTLASKKICSK